MKAKITPKNIFAYLQGNWRMFLLENFPNGIDKHIEEQYYWRISQVEKKSPECLKGKCVSCSCETPELFLSSKECSNTENQCYGPMLNKEQWELFKQTVDKPNI